MAEPYRASQAVFAPYRLAASPNVAVTMMSASRFIRFSGHRRARVCRARVPGFDPTMGRARYAETELVCLWRQDLLPPH